MLDLAIEIELGLVEDSMCEFKLSTVGVEVEVTISVVLAIYVLLKLVKMVVAELVSLDDVFQPVNNDEVLTLDEK